MRRGLLVSALLVGAAAAAAAQSAALSVMRPDSAPRVQLTSLLADGRFVELMRSGFPLRLHYRLELWRDRSNWFDQFVREATWDAVARHDPLADDFVLIRSGGAVTRYATAEDLERALDVAYRVQLFPRASGRFYYFCRLEVTTLNDTDLQELTRWLKGEVSPAVSGDGNVGDALARGVQRVLVRIAGLPRLTLETRSTQFRYPT